MNSASCFKAVSTLLIVSGAKSEIEGQNILMTSILLPFHICLRGHGENSLLSFMLLDADRHMLVLQTQIFIVSRLQYRAHSTDQIVEEHHAKRVLEDPVFEYRHANVTEPVLFKEFTQVELICVVLSLFTIFEPVRACQVVDDVLEVLAIVNQR